MHFDKSSCYGWLLSKCKGCGRDEREAGSLLGRGRADRFHGLRHADEPSKQPVTIVSDPLAAEVLMGAEAAGRTPTDVWPDRADGKAAFRLQKDGFAPQYPDTVRTLLAPWPDRSARGRPELDTGFVPDLCLRSPGPAPSGPPAASDDREAAR